VARVLVGGLVHELGSLAAPGAGWQRVRLNLGEALRQPASAAASVSLAGIHGTANILVTSLRVLDHEGRETLRVSHGRPMTIEIDYEIREPGLSERADLLVGFHRDGVQDVAKCFTNSLLFDAASRACGRVWMRVPRVSLPNGTYSVSLTLARAGYYAGNPAVFYSINPQVHTCLSRFLEIVVADGDLVGSGSGVVLDADWGFAD
jgi:hypothetical protein